MTLEYSDDHEIYEEDNQRDKHENIKAGNLVRKEISIL